LWRVISKLQLAFMSYQQFQNMLRADAAAIAFSVILLSAGLVAIALFFYRFVKKDYILLVFGIFSALEGTRLFLHSATAKVLLGLTLGFQRHVWNQVGFLLPVPGFLFCAQLLAGTDFRRRLFWFWVVPLSGVIAIVGVASDLFFPWLLFFAFDVLSLFVVAAIILIASLLLRDLFRHDHRSGPEMRAFAIGFAAMGVFVVHANLIYLGFPGPNLEPVGFFIFICVLGYITVLRSLRNEEQLMAVKNELEVARQIQSSILPRDLPKVAGTEIAACYTPMAAVGGDFYEFLPVDDHRLGILIADVSGHGVPAALVASMIKVAVSAQLDNASLPAQLLFGLNRILCSNLRGQYVTAAYLFLDAKNKRLAYAGAGHPPALLWCRATRTTRFLEGTGLMLGLFPEAQYGATEMPWNPGDRCLLYTDGITEAENLAEISFGRERLEQLIEAADGCDSKTLSQRLLKSVAAWRGRGRDDPQDDMTVIAIQFAEAGSGRLAQAV
jgi:sigma-B regulation protein RsbU (phosphoserine phosphatase)